jgi:dimethylamine monooxygenase subunit A
MNLPLPSRFFPVDGSRFEVGPRLKPLGNEKFFHFDSEFPAFRKNKLSCRRERLTKYLATHQLSVETERATLDFMIERLLTEHPAFFKKSSTPQGFEFECLLTGEVLCFDKAILLTGVKASNVTPAYVSAFDALCCQIQEDIAITQKEGDRNFVAGLHLCAPSHCAAEDKIGKDFRLVHQPVPGIEKMNRTAEQLVQASIYKGPYLRFVFMFSKDNRLNHHLEPSPGFSLDEWRGWDLDFNSPCPFFLRVERQVVWGLPAVNAFLFSIHIYFTSGAEIKRDPIMAKNLRSTMQTMTSETLQYKGLKVPPEKLIEWVSGN